MGFEVFLAAIIEIIIAEKVVNGERNERLRVRHDERYAVVV